MEIERVIICDDVISIKALIDNKVLVSPGNFYEPPEYAEAWCWGNASLGDIPAWIPIDQMSQIEQIRLIEQYVDLKEVEWLLDSCFDPE